MRGLRISAKRRSFRHTVDPLAWEGGTKLIKFPGLTEEEEDKEPTSNVSAKLMRSTWTRRMRDREPATDALCAGAEEEEDVIMDPGGVTSPLADPRTASTNSLSTLAWAFHGEEEEEEEAEFPTAIL